MVKKRQDTGQGRPTFDRLLAANHSRFPSVERVLRDRRSYERLRLERVLTDAELVVAGIDASLDAIAIHVRIYARSQALGEVRELPERVRAEVERGLQAYIGQILDLATVSGATKFSLDGVASADIVITGDGTQFDLQNAVMS